MFSKRSLFVVALFTAACSKAPAPAPRIAVLRFENLTSDPGLDWAGRAASEALTRQIGAIPSAAIYRANETFGGRPIQAPGVSTEITDAILAGANVIITGYFEKVNGKLQFTAVEQDAKTGKWINSATVPGPLLAACDRLARQFSSSVRPYRTKSETALKGLVLGVEGGGETFYEQAIAADPKYAEPYLSWSEAARVHNDPALLRNIVLKAKENQLDSTTIARLELAEAMLGHDPEARIAALKKVIAADPGDTNTLQALGELEMATHRFAAAADAFGKGASAARPDLINLKAYALMFNGDEKGAVSAVREYQHARPSEANPIDSEADIQLYFGHFAEAEKGYLAAGVKDPQFGSGWEGWKAARARLLTGDVGGATELFNRYREGRKKANDPFLPFQESYWLFLTGDRSAAVDAMRALASSTQSPALKVLSLCQLSIWELYLGQKPEAIRDSEAVLKTGQGPAVLPAALVRFSAAGVTDLDKRAASMFAAPAVTGVRPLATGYALAFAGKWAQSQPIWSKLYAGNNPNDQSFAYLLAGADRASGKSSDAVALLRYFPLPAAAATPSFECLYFPAIFEWRGDQATYLKLSGHTATPAQ